MTREVIIGKKPTQHTNAEKRWVEDRRVASRPVATKRLTVDVDHRIHHLIKLEGVKRGKSISEIIREFLEEKFPVEES